MSDTINTKEPVRFRFSRILPDILRGETEGSEPVATDFLRKLGHDPHEHSIARVRVNRGRRDPFRGVLVRGKTGKPVRFYSERSIRSLDEMVRRL